MNALVEARSAMDAAQRGVEAANEKLLAATADHRRMMEEYAAVEARILAPLRCDEDAHVTVTPADLKRMEELEARMLNCGAAVDRVQADFDAAFAACDEARARVRLAIGDKR